MKITTFLSCTFHTDDGQSVQRWDWGRHVVLEPQQGVRLETLLECGGKDSPRAALLPLHRNHPVLAKTRGLLGSEQVCSRGTPAQGVGWGLGSCWWSSPHWSLRMAGLTVWSLIERWLRFPTPPRQPQLAGAGPGDLVPRRFGNASFLNPSFPLAPVTPQLKLSPHLAATHLQHLFSAFLRDTPDILAAPSNPARLVF